MEKGIPQAVFSQDLVFRELIGHRSVSLLDTEQVAPDDLYATPTRGR
jgi:hypothetical protein